ncbi:MULTISPECIES: DUF3050 domain-containing protein [Thermoactinomyces]|uniref:DUF3050 domain-containing protein n=1 Tax=Thermoactinomyces daqus TaxID=1329516 RepID=A0A7W1XA51_9BACL|nr:MULTISPECIES: DUF3050 domain-containing protein [Thermoactinomyces]MBA4542783.1 DUF3050 domain-containing protein [Thermoactinomyces daqus]MBH8598544.1 DUF3050 domain-containing protein [Thermoactinomyces sp. CICC 10523]MBH8604612.1 DUF3050 domain-containing protein [Thermoactinomyces sp. CICC 10522]MBH8606929.1 DUF3050 domain-containing protein [Thermoactinomyces sp. CICC 10521]
MKTLETQSLQAARKEILTHALLSHLHTEGNVRIFMKHHIFVVWVYMSLLKKLQQSFTCVSLPWLPRTNASFARFLNELAVWEETDKDGKGNYASHFEIYFQAMEEMKADTNPIETYLQMLQAGYHPVESLFQSEIPPSAADFTKQCLELAGNGQLHEVASAFCYGYEYLVPELYARLAKSFSKISVSERLIYFLNRHTQISSNKRAPIAENLLLTLCGEDPVKIGQAEKVAHATLAAWRGVLDGILAEIKRQ